MVTVSRAVAGPVGATREPIPSAAERAFAEHGLSAVSDRAAGTKEEERP
ncbi:hypothetical protein [Nocardiopsis akebiae]|nr:hypothetical protein [Nocardiopsis akebiae]